MKYFLSLTAVLLISGSNGWAASESRASSTADTAIEITASLVTPHDIVVEWKDPVPGAAGHIVEWGTKPDDNFIILGFLPPKATTYKHENLMGDTTCYYRVRAYYGPVSPEIEISLPKELSDADYAKRFSQSEDYSWAPPKTTPDEKPVEKKSIFNAATAAAAAPANFKITLQPVSVSGFKLTWTDRASDEEGFIIEFKPEGRSEFRVVALVPPDTNSFGWALEPPARKATMRVRPYYYGKPSALVHQLTGPRPEEGQRVVAPSPKPSK